MDNNNWRVAQSLMAQGPPQGGQVGGGEVSAVPNAATPTTMDAGDWRAQLQADSRQRIVNKIMDTLKRHLPFSGQEGLQELKKIAVRFEEKIYTAATSQSDYLRKISLKLLAMETKSQNPMANPLQANASSTSKNPPDQAVHSTQPQIQNQPLPMPVVNSQSQPQQQLLLQNMQTDLTSAGVQNSALLTSTLPTVGNLVQAPMPNVIGQNSILQNMQSIPSVSQNPVGNTIGHGMPSNVFTNSQRQMQARQQHVVPSQQQQESQNPQNFLYQQQLQHQFMKQKLHQGGGMAQRLMQTHIHQQQHQQQTSVVQQPVLPAAQQPQQQQLQLIGQQFNATNIQHNQLIGQQNSFPMQQQQQLLQRQLLMQPQHQHQQMKPQQQPAQLPGHQMSPLHQMTASNDLKARQQMGVKSGVFQQHHLPYSQRATYHHQKLKSGSSFPISSPQVLQAASPLVPPNASPQIDQQSLQTCITKTGTPLQSANSSFVVPSPLTPLALSPLPGELEKLNSSTSSLVNAGNIGHSHATTVSAAVHSLAVGTSGISASPLLVEFTSLDGAHVNTSTVIPWKNIILLTLLTFVSLVSLFLFCSQ